MLIIPSVNSHDFVKKNWMVLNFTHDWALSTVEQLGIHMRFPNTKNILNAVKRIGNQNGVQPDV